MTNKKLEKLKNILRKMKKVLIAYSGGVDSTFLLKIAVDTLGTDDVVAVTALSPTYTKSQYKQAKRIARKLGFKHKSIFTDELNIKNFSGNPKNRCYHCKKELFQRLLNIAARLKIGYVLDGTNYDDRKDYRPGAKALKELGIKSPLYTAKLVKKDIRKFSKKMGLLTWNTPQMACLASRFPYNTKITEESLKMVEAAEDCIRKLGFKNVRVRHYDRLARIEVDRNKVRKLFQKNISKKVVSDLKKIGYLYITVDLEGYRTGSMNEEMRKSKF